MDIILKCEGKTNPVCTTKKPTFSWYCVSDGTEGNFQTSYRIRVFDKKQNIYWNSGKIESDNSLYITYEGKELLSHTKYYWDVEIETDTGVYKSASSYFVTGLSDDDWTAKWIAGDCKNAPVFQKTFDLYNDGEAYAYICGLGYFELYINDQRVGDDYYVPNRTDYDDIQYFNLQYPFEGKTKKRVKYLCYEVSGYLNNGQNKIEIWLGNGWYKQEDRQTEGLFKYDELKMIFQLHTEKDCIVSDESWSVYGGPIEYNNIFYGEVFRAATTSKPTSVRIAKAPEADFIPQLAPTDKVMETVIPERVTKNIYDCKKIIAGIASIKCKGQKGGKITIKYAECLDENSHLDYKSTAGYDEGDCNQIQKDTYILAGNDEDEYTPHFVWHAFRYFEIETENADLTDVKALYIHSSMEQTSEFECSNQLLNDIHSMYLNSQKTVLHGGVPVDCPGREKLGYTGDGQATSNCVMFNFDGYAFYKKWICDILDTQNDVTGFVPHSAPFMGGGGGPAWGSAVAIVPWNHYLHYGDKAVLRQCLPKIEKWILYLKNKRNEKGLVDREENGSWCLGDWCLPIEFEWSKPCFDKIKIPSELVNTCIYIRCIKIYQAMLKELGEDAYDYSAELKSSTDDVNREFLNKYYSNGVQGCDVFPLYVDIVPDNCKENVVDNLKRNIENNDFCFDTGIFGTGYMLDVLSRYGLNDYAYKLMTQTKYPSYGNMLKQGATAVWETWEGTGAHSHEGLGCFDFWFHQCLVGIKPRMGGFKEFDINPYFADELTYVKGSYLTVYGRISVKWVREKDKIKLEVTVPFNTTANLNVPGKMIKLHPGKTIIEI